MRMPVAALALLLLVALPRAALAQGTLPVIVFPGGFRTCSAATRGWSARRSWAQAHQRQLVGYIRAYRAGLAWLYDRTNRAEALAVLLSSYERTRR
jgi:ABC-type nitrate/sulfonate/bicarbonate transport system substrate-binding protein